MIITAIHFSKVLFIKMLTNKDPSSSAHWKGNNDRLGKAIMFNATINERAVYMLLYTNVLLVLFFLIDIISMIM